MHSCIHIHIQIYTARATIYSIAKLVSPPPLTAALPTCVFVTISENFSKMKAVASTLVAGWGDEVPSGLACPGLTHLMTSSKVAHVSINIHWMKSRACDLEIDKCH